MPAAIWDELTPRLVAIEAALRHHLAEGTRQAPTRLREAMAYSLLAPGKRLRPLLTVLAAEAVGGDLDAALPAACAVEMVHTYSLVHDDLPAMDDDDLRRGLSTCHKKFDEATAILAGDALLTLAFGVLAGGYPPATASVSLIELAAGAGAAGMVGGQMLDLEAESGGASPRIDHLETIHRLKTGALFRTALRLGLYAAQAERVESVDPTALTHLDAFADAFGLLFQVTDDLLDVESCVELAGKRVGKDAALGKLTYPGLLGVAESRARAAELGRLSVSAAEALGGRARPLADLARFVVQRDR